MIHFFVKSAGLAAPVRVASARLSCTSAASFSWPVRWRQRVNEERSKGSSCWKNSSPCMDGPGFARDLGVPTDGSLAIVYPAFGCGLIRPLALMGSESSTPFHRIALKVRGEDRDWSSPVFDRLPSRRCPSQGEGL